MLNVDDLTPDELRAIAAAAIAYRNSWASRDTMYEVEKHRIELMRVVCRVKEAHDAEVQR